MVHARIAGAKGLWLLHPSPEHQHIDDPPRIWIRKSQTKVKHSNKEGWHRSLRILDLVRFQRLTIPSNLNSQTILNMSSNGVPDDIFKTLMEECFKEEIEPFTKWTGPGVCEDLAKAIERAGKIMGSRQRRRVGADARLFNFALDDDDDNDDDDDDQNSEKVVGELIERNQTSGQPLSLYEQSRSQLLAGFNPIDCPSLREKLKSIVNLVISRKRDKYHIPIPQSAEAFIVPGG